MESLEIVDVIRKIVENEVRKLHIAEVGEVTSVFPHSSESDKNNFECNVKLKYRELELRKVPVATQQIGLANIPHVGDLVLVTFINGNVNAPVIVGRLYSDEDRPPLSKEEEVIYIPPYSENTDLKRIHVEFPGGMVLSVKDNIATIEANKTTLTLKRDGNVEIKSRSDVKISGSDIVLSGKNIKLQGKKSIELESQDSAQVTCGTNISFEVGDSTSIRSGSSTLIRTGSTIGIESGGSAMVKSGGSIGVESAANTTVKSGANTLVQSGANLALKGAKVAIN